MKIKKRTILLGVLTILLSPIFLWVFFGAGKYVICDFFLLRTSGKEAAQTRCNSSIAYEGTNLLELPEFQHVISNEKEKN